MSTALTSDGARTPRTRVTRPRPSLSEAVRFVRAERILTDSSSLRAPGNCPAGMYLVPTPEALTKWAGMFFVHRGESAFAM